MNNKFKKIWILFIVLIVLATPVLFANAQEGLVTCGRNIDNDPKTILSGEEECSLCHLFVLAQNVTNFLTFDIAPILAILVIAYGGFNIFLAGASPDKVKTGRNAITKAAVGLLIVFGAWMAINEVLLFLSQQGTGTAKIFNEPWTDITCSTKTLPTEPIAPSPSVSPPISTTWGDDGDVRAALMKDGFAIDVNRANCSTVGQGKSPPEGIGGVSCTSVYQLGSKAISGIRSLQTKCKSYSSWYQYCGITITGGTEYWLHGNKNMDLSKNTTDHKPGNNVVDIRVGSATFDGIAATIQAGLSLGTQSQCSTLGKAWKLDGNIYVLEDPGKDNEHWHVCYY